MRRYRFIRAEQAHSPVAIRSRVRGVVRSGDDAWAQHGASARARADEALTTQIAAAHGRRRATHGAPQVHAELRTAEVRGARERVARLMRAVVCWPFTQSGLIGWQFSHGSAKDCRRMR